MLDKDQLPNLELELQTDLQHQTFFSPTFLDKQQQMECSSMVSVCILSSMIRVLAFMFMVTIVQVEVLQVLVDVLSQHCSQLKLEDPSP